ncbi:hypothetical protein EYF80_042935 [Liparis tanakae]|uniref:Uncharacterized protein n=1 Tax=Liparis tanakae TaxID=230148 RepID=A0A4Z2G036_9TELE|nr:hypothetical protein EYF80_042935 [Liparis tanakae]
MEMRREPLPTANLFSCGDHLTQRAARLILRMTSVGFQAPSFRVHTVTHVMLFWCSVSRAVLRSSVVALLSMFLKRSMAEMFLWMLCLGMSSFDAKVSASPSSQRNSMGQQSWP